MHTKEESIIRKACEILEIILNDKFGEKLVQQKEFALQGNCDKLTNIFSFFHVLFLIILLHRKRIYIL